MKDTEYRFCYQCASYCNEHDSPIIPGGKNATCSKGNGLGPDSAVASTMCCSQWSEK